MEEKNFINTLKNIQNSTHKSIKSQLSKYNNEYVILKCIILTIDSDNKFIYVVTDNITQDRFMIKCVINDNMAIFTKGQYLCLKGKICCDKQSTGIYIEIMSYIPITYDLKNRGLKDPSNVFIKYDKFRNTLLTKFSQNIDFFKKREEPKMIYNIGLIIIYPKYDKNINYIDIINNFKVNFAERCVGNIYIYYVENMDDINKNFINALEYFKKYRFIDIVCILGLFCGTDNIEMSSRKNIKYMIYRKNHPYIVSINHNNPEIFPLTSLLSNNTFGNIDECINKIHNIQFSFKTNIERKIESTKNKMKIILKKIDNNRIFIKNKIYCNVYNFDDKKKELNIFRSLDELPKKIYSNKILKIKNALLSNFINKMFCLNTKYNSLIISTNISDENKETEKQN